MKGIIVDTKKQISKLFSRQERIVNRTEIFKTVEMESKQLCRIM